MFTTLVSAAALLSALAIRGASAQDAFAIDTPVMTQCQDVHVTWSGGKAPFNLIVVPSDAPCDQVLVDLGDHQGQSITWNVGIAAGTQVMLSLQDANEDEAWSGIITVGGNDDSSCLAAASSAASSAAPSSSVSPADAEPTPATTLTVAPDANTPAANAGASPTDSAADSSSTDGAAVPIGAANAGVLPNSSGASTMHKIGGSVVALGAVAAFFLSM
ncbi:hypothetical protein PsYK624_047690 [Phanerochaete sordida]|uniref:Uncharacterized protein n=1 Tax=Phanerochaete sordida TaxID=48140 RepID=A0A9P3G5K3_9APHY|nr:hypothetical protein PsYK624_047690 [Phanerochaete sordida]